MTLAGSPDRDGAEVEALVADRYLDALLAAGERRAHDAPADAELDPDLRAAARVLRRALVRVHPSFRFEERLAERLADLAAARSVAGAIVPFPGAAGRVGSTAGLADPLLDAILRGELDPAAEAEPGPAPGVTGRRPLIVGGAVTSAALSLAGVAFVAWRASRPGGHPGPGIMVRAVRSAHARLAAGLVLGGPA